MNTHLNYKTVMRSTAILLINSILLASCTPVAFLTGATAGGLLVANHSRLSSLRQDYKIVKNIRRRWSADMSLRRKTHLTVTSYQGTVLLLGQAPTAEQRLRAYQIAMNTPGIKRLYNQIAIQGPISPLTRSSDAWITAKAKSELLTKTHLKAAPIKVITENGNVYLMGKVSKAEGRLVAHIVRRVAGVQKVITLFEQTDNE